MQLGVRVEVHGDGVVVLYGQVASAERRLLVARVAAEHAPGLTIRSEVTVTEVLPPDAPEVLPLPEELAPAPEVPPPHEASP